MRRFPAYSSHLVLVVAVLCHQVPHEDLVGALVVEDLESGQCSNSNVF